MVTGKDIKNNGTIIKLDKERRFNLDLNAFCELEEEFGDMEKAFAELDKGSMKGMRAFLYAGLKSDDETLTEKKVGKLITINNITEISTVIGKTVDEVLPDEEAEDTKNK